MHEFGALWEKRRGVLTVEIVDILVGVGRDDGFWSLSGHGEEEISRSLVLFMFAIAITVIIHDTCDKQISLLLNLIPIPKPPVQQYASSPPSNPLLLSHRPL